MLKKLGKIVFISIVAFGQPITVAADAINLYIQINEIKDIDNMNENNSKESMEEHDKFGIFETILDKNSEDNLTTNKSEDDTCSDEKLEKSTISIYYTKEDIYLQNDPQPEIDKEVVNVRNLVSGVWGTCNWEYNEETSTMRVFEGEGGFSNQYPWNRSGLDVDTLIFEGTVILRANSSDMFSRFRGSKLRGLENLDTSNVTNMGQMFMNVSVEDLDLSSFNTSNVTNMNSMFSNSEVKNLNISNFITSNVTFMNRMFMNSKAEHLDLSNFDTKNVRGMQQMFSNSSVRYLDLSNFNTSNVTSMENMFQNAHQLMQLSLGPTTVFNSSVNLPEVPSNSEFSGIWQSVGTGTVSNPVGEFQFTSFDLMSNYDGKTMSDVYVWKPNLLGGRIVVRYEDIDGVQLSEVVIINSEQIGMPYMTDEKEFPGYSLIKTPENAIGVFTSEEQEVRYIYERTDAAPVTVKHKDSEGNQLAEPVILSGKVG
ncbi:MULTISPECIES: BspA family leucine-rich repeat surface protein, partial [unclassified Enterococcus]